MIAVIGPKNDNGVISQIVSLQCIEHSTYLAIDKTHTGEVGLNNLNLFTFL